MKGIVLAAGRGQRMGPVTDDRPKCMLQVHGRALLDWAQQALQQAGIRDIGVVTGYRREAVRFDGTRWHNAHWSDSNMVASLCCAEDWLHRHECLVSYSDVVCAPTDVRLLQQCAGDVVVLQDPDWLQQWSMRFDDPLSDAESFKMQGDRVVDIGRRGVTLDQIQGQYMGLLKITPNGWRQLKHTLDAMHTARVEQLDMTALLQSHIQRGGRVMACAAQSPWFEVDNAHDWQLIEAMPCAALPAHPPH